jgi:hypothetical protein
MKKILRIERICAAALVGLVVLSAQSAAAQDHGSATFVTGLSMSNGSALGSAISTVSEGFAHRVNLGGRVTVHLAPGFDAIGEAGRIANVLPPLTTAALSFSPIEIGASAFYTEGGMRALLGSSRSVVSPYVEATGGIARVNLRVSGINSTADDLLRLGLGFASTTSPMAGLGAGVMLQAGRVTFDTGYRYKKIFSQNIVDTLLSRTQELTLHQAVFGIGVKF